MAKRAAERLLGLEVGFMRRLLNVKQGTAQGGDQQARYEGIVEEFGQMFDRMQLS